MIDLLDRQVLFVGGKGGVGKTTTASALGLMAAKHNRRCLLVSTDPAHSLGDIFGKSIGDHETVLILGLWGLEIDPEAAADRHIASVKDNMRSFIRPALYNEIDRQMDLARLAPGTIESAMLERMSELIVEAYQRYDLVIFDTAPTGQTLRLLSLPEMMAAWTEGLLKRRERSSHFGKILDRLSGKRRPGARDELSYLSDKPAASPSDRDSRIREILLQRGRKFRRARRILLDRDKSGFILVLNPEKLPILESKKALVALNQFKVPVQAMIINRVLPAAPQGSFIDRRRQQEAEYLAEIERDFSELKRYYVPLLEHDVYGIETLTQIGRRLLESV